MVPLNLLFPLQRVICPQSRQSSKYNLFYNSLLIILLTTILPMEKSYLSVVSKHPTLPAPLTAPPCHRRDPGTCNPESLLYDRPSRQTCPVFFFREKPRSPSVLSPKHRPPKKVGVRPKPIHCSPPSTDHSEGAHTSLSPQGERVAEGGTFIPLRRCK